MWSHSWPMSVKRRFVAGGSGSYASIDRTQDFEAARSKAMKCGAVNFVLEDMKREFVEELIYRKRTSSQELSLILLSCRAMQCYL